MQRFSNTVATTATTIAITATTHHSPLPPTQPQAQARNIDSRITSELTKT
jgi:hypothetical protein